MSNYQRGGFATRRERVIAMPNEHVFRAYFVPMCFLVTLAFLIVAYLVIMNALTSKSFEIKSLTTNVTELKRENKRLEVEIAQQESIANLADRVSVLQMVPVTKMEYITIPNGPVAYGN